MTRPALATTLRWVGAVLVSAGLATLIWCGLTIVRTDVFQARAETELAREIPLRPAQESATPREGQLLGSLSIPRVGVSSVILEGDDHHILALSVGHIPGTALPGEGGNIGLAGHRDTLFRGLRNIRDGDRILLATPGETRVYVVDSTHIVKPNDVAVLDNTGKPLLTLVTCYPFYYIGSAPDRFIVQAHPATGST